MDKGSMLDWAEVSGPAQEIFRIWMSASSKELDWANTAWIALGRAGLTNYGDEVDKTRVLVRFLTLGTIFREFCELARNEVFAPCIYLWADTLEIEPIRVGQVLGRNTLKESKENLDLEVAIDELMDQNRSEITSALVRHFGNESALFLSLWRASDGAEIEAPELDDSAVLNEVTPEKMRTFEWIGEGMPRLH
jgi:hypothetical protein